MPSPTAIIRERELASTPAVSGLGGALVRWELLVVLDLKVPEANRDDLAGFVGSDWALLVAA